MGLHWLLFRLLLLPPSFALLHTHMYFCLLCLRGGVAPKGAGAQPAYAVVQPRSSLSPLRGASPKAIEFCGGTDLHFGRIGYHLFCFGHH